MTTKSMHAASGTPLLTQMLLTVMLPIVILMSILTFLIYNEIKSETSEIMLHSGEQVVQGNAAEVSATLAGLQEQIAIIATTPMLTSAEHRAIALPNWLKSNISEMKFAEMLFFIDKNSQATYFSSEGKLGQADLSQRHYVKELLSGRISEVFTNPVVSTATKQPVSVIAKAVTDSEGKVVGALAMTVTLEVLSTITNKAKLTKTSYAWIVDGTGLIIAHPSEKARMSTNVTNSDKDGFKGLDEHGRRMVAGESGTGDILNIQGESVTMIFSQIKSTPGWTFGMSVPTTELYATVNQLSSKLVLIMLFSLFIVIVLVVLASLSQAKSIAKLAKAMENVANTDSGINARLTASGPREVRVVTQNFNFFMDKLGRSVESIIQVAEGLTAASKTLEQTGSTLNQQVAMQSQEMDQVASAASELTSTFEEVAHHAQLASDESVRVKAQANKGYEALMQSQKQISVLSEIGRASCRERV